MKASWSFFGAFVMVVSVPLVVLIFYFSGDERMVNYDR